MLPIFGVVIWQDLHKGRGVIWCEDQGDLVYWSFGPDMTEGEESLVGSVVRFVLQEEAGLRRARDVRVVEVDAAPNLVNLLRHAASLRDSTLAERRDDKIVLFPGVEAVPQPGLLNERRG